MGILGRSHPKNGKGAGTTVVAAGTNLVGELALDDNLHVDGKLDGSIHSKSEVIIGQSGLVEGEIRARRVLVSGSFVGKIEADRLEIVSSGKVIGEVSVAQLVIESGAHFNGTSRIRGDEPPRQITHDKSQAETAELLSEETLGIEEAEIVAEPDSKDEPVETAASIRRGTRR